MGCSRATLGACNASTISAFTRRRTCPGAGPWRCLASKAGASRRTTPDPEKLVRDLQDQFPRAQFIGGDGAFEKLAAHVVGFVEAPQRGLKLPLDLQGTAFQERVWQALRKIPVGTTVSYADIAKRPEPCARLHRRVGQITWQ